MLNYNKKVVFLISARLPVNFEPRDTITALNQTSNATFHCTCTECNLTAPLYWILLRPHFEERFYDTNSNGTILSQRGITYSSSDSSAIITIPDRIENNNTILWCAAFLPEGGSDLSNSVIVAFFGKPINIIFTN